MPGNYNICQFCGADVSAVPRPAEQKTDEKAAYKMVTKGTMAGFYVVSAFYVLIGAMLLCLGIGLFGNIGDFMKNIYIVFGTMTSLLGIGLLFRAAFVYAMMGIFCALQFVLGVVFIIASVMTIDAPLLKYSVIGLAVIQILAAGLMFYFSEETSRASMSH
ncbi:MAG TPA: hypothetical protein VGL56_00480 [Fimbriimonadaceae bacterium]